MPFKTLCKAVEAGNANEAKDIARKHLEKGDDPLRMIDALTETMNKLGELFARLEIFLPQLKSRSAVNRGLPKAKSFWES